MALVSYCLMGTHYHVVVHTPDRRVSLALKRLHGDYSRYVNRVLGRGAHLFRAHCFAKRIEDDRHLLTTCRYLALNPVEAGLSREAVLWPWSNARATAGLQRPRIPLHERPSKPPSEAAATGGAATAS